MAFPIRVVRRFLVRAVVVVSFLMSIFIIMYSYLGWPSTTSLGLFARPTTRAPTRPTIADIEYMVGEPVRSPTTSTHQVEMQDIARRDGPTRQSEVLTIEKERAAEVTMEESRLPCANVHIFYYPWYANPMIDQHYSHWNHNIIPHWDKQIDKLYDKKPHVPPNDIGSDFYPQLGPYSSRDPEVIREHFEEISSAGIGVIVVSYYPPGMADENGKSWDDIYLILLDQAARFDIKVTFQIEPYKNRNEKTVRDDIVRITNMYGSHQGFYKYKYKNNSNMPFIYVYDSYHTQPEDWARVLSTDGLNTIRGTKYDAVVIALAVEFAHTRYVTVGGFDGLYTYFATNGFTFGSTWKNWPELARVCQESDALFIPSVGPGYVDTSIRPWNRENTRERAGGKYYKNSWKSALNISPQIISITSFNEWHEGTQIEKAVPKLTGTRKYSDYKPFDPDYYLKLTKTHVDEFSQCKKQEK
eukprot:gene135-747_t